MDNKDFENKNLNEIDKENLKIEMNEIIENTKDLEKTEEQLKREELKAIILKEKEEKKEKQKQKRKKVKKVVFKTSMALSCCLCVGAGIGIGSVTSKAFIAKKEQSSFKFEIPEVSDKLKDNAILTSASASTIFKEVGDSVVNISTKATSGFFSNELRDLGSGSGIIYKVDGDKVYIITNNHVIEGAQYVTISVTGEEQVEANLIGADPRSDLAVLSVSKNDMKQSGIQNVNVAKFANSDEVEVGDFVFPIGNALGRGKVMTQGMISAQNKQINIDGKDLTVIQTDAAINPGNSGGALMNAEGEVVGINTAKLSSSAIEGIGYAIPSNIAKDIVDQIIDNGFVERPHFGIMAKTITEKTKRIYGINTNGVIVIEVEKGSNAEKAGLKTGDIIVSFNGEQIKTVDDLSNAINKCKPNDTVSFDILREISKPMTLTVTLSSDKTNF